MKKLISLILAVMMVLSMAVSAFASDDFFVPSTGGGNHGLIRARIRMPNGEYIENLEDFNHEIEAGAPYDPTAPDQHSDCCLVVTHITEYNKTALPENGEKELLYVYQQLKSGAMELPYEKAGFGGKQMSVIDLYEVSFLCKEHNEMLIPEGVVNELTLEVPAPKGVAVCAMSYDNGAWTPAVSAVNNGNSTVTVVLEHLCPIVFAIEGEYEGGSVNLGGEENNPTTGAPVFVGAAVIAAAAVLAFKRSK